MKKLNSTNTVAAFPGGNLHQKLPIVIFLLVFIQIIAPINNSLFAQWRQITPAYGGVGACFYVDGNEVFMGTRGGGIYYSSDYGQHWSPRSVGLNTLSIRQIDKGGDVLFASATYGVYKSIDNGRSWQFHEVGQGESVHGLIVVDSLVFAGTLFGRIYVSSDFGESWQLEHYFGLNNPILRFRMFDSTIFACVSAKQEGGGLLVSIDNGLSWKYENTGLSNPRISDITKLNDSYFITDLSLGVYKSDGPEFSWTQVNNGLVDWRLQSIYAFNGTLFAGGLYDWLYRSNDYGENWTEIAINHDKGQVNEITSINDNILIGVEGEGVLKSSDIGDTWEPYNDGLSNVGIWAICCEDNLVYASVVGKGLYVSDDEGQSWTLISEGIPEKNIRSFAYNDHTLFAGTAHEGLFRSFDDGQTWENLLNGGNVSLTINTIKTKGDTVLTNLHKSFDNGDSWDRVGPVSSPTDFEFINNVTIASSEWDGMFRSTDLSGNAWTQVFTWPKMVYELDKWNNTIFAATISESVKKSEDEGLTWESFQYNLPSNYSETITVAYNRLIVGIWDEGLFDICADGGTEWFFVSAIPNILHPKYLHLQHAHDYLYVTVEGYGLWKYPYPISGIGEGAQANESELIISLSQNTLIVGVNPPEHFLQATLNITSMSGSTVYQSDFDGNQTKKIDTKSFMSGLYIVSMHSGRKQLSKKIIIR